MATDGPLAGVRVVVTRASEQASSLASRLTGHGAAVIEVPTIAIVDASDGGRGLREALARIVEFDWLVITSPNGARRVAAALVDTDQVAMPPRVKLAAVGPGTAATLDELGIEADLVPERFVAEGLLEAFPAPPPGGGRVLLAQAAGARSVLAEGLDAEGWSVERAEAYRTDHPPVPADLLARVAAADVITFTSASTVRGWVAAAGVEATPPTVVSIGPVTTAAALELGIAVTAEADPHTIDGLISSIIGAVDRSV